MSLRFVSSLLLMAALSVAGPAAQGRTRPHYGGTLRVEIQGDPWQRPGGLARRLVLDGLVRIDAAGLPAPALAVRWSQENDAHRWQFWLRPGVRFQDGSPLTAADAAASLAANCGTDCPWTAVRAAGSSVVFTGDLPMPNLPSLLAGDDFLLARTDISAAGGITGTGAFQAAGLANGVLTLAANENCWQGRPFVDAVEIHGRRAIRDQWLDLSVGKADVVEVPAEQIRLAQQQRLNLVSRPAVTLLALQVGETAALANPAVRAALALAIDRVALFNVIYQKQGEITASLLPNALSGYSFLFPAERDLNRSREIRGGLTAPPLILVAEGGTTVQLAAQRIALNLHEAGFNVQVAGQNSARGGDLRLRELSLQSSSPAAVLEGLLRRAGYVTAIKADTSASLYKAEHEFLDRRTLIPLLYTPRIIAISGRVRDLRLGVDGMVELAGASLEDAP